MKRARVREPFGPAGVAAVILAAALGFGWMSGLLLAGLQKEPITDAGAALLNGIGQVLAGAVATFLGSQIVSRRPTVTEETEEPAETPRHAAGDREEA